MSKIKDVICLNVDRLPISNSSGSQLYLILVNLFNNKKHVEEVGIYLGSEIPLNANEFLSEAKDLINNRLIFNRRIWLKLKVSFWMSCKIFYYIHKGTFRIHVM